MQNSFSFIFQTWPPFGHRSYRRRTGRLRVQECERIITKCSLCVPRLRICGGEIQRIKLSAHLGSRGRLYILDEPSTGLHAKNIELLLTLLRRLVSEGNTVVIVEHRLERFRPARAMGACSHCRSQKTSLKRNSSPRPPGLSTSAPTAAPPAAKSSSKAPRKRSSIATARRQGGI